MYSGHIFTESCRNSNAVLNMLMYPVSFAGVMLNNSWLEKYIA